MSDSDHFRRAERVPLSAEVTLLRRFDNRYRVKLVDFSPEGCRIELVERVQPGETLWIALPGIETLEATVCWVDNFIAGVKFAHPLYPSVFEMLSANMGGSAGCTY